MRGLPEHRSILLGIVLGVLGLWRVVAAEDVSDPNWVNHPEIQEIRALRDAIESAEHAGRLGKSTRTCAEGGSFEMAVSLFKDQKGVVRKYVIEAGSGDATGVARYYYDENGALRFSFRARRSVTGSASEDRSYFDARGKHLYTSRKADGSTWRDGFPEVIEDPLADWAARCED